MSSQNIKGKILLIEDEPGFRRIYSCVLKNAGYEIMEAEDGEKGLEMAIEHQPALVLLDLMLPKLHGFEVLKKIRATESIKDTPVIIFSVMGEQREIEQGVLLGATDYTIKGFYSPKDILSKIENALLNTTAKKNANSYFLFVDNSRGDAAKIRQAFGLPTLFNCPLCQKPLVLEMEMLPNHTQAIGHWFASHFMCTHCHKNF